MSLESVRAFLAEHAPDLEVLEKATSTATVAEAAAAHGVEPAQIAKTLSLWLKDEVVLLILGGDAKIDNRKFKAQFKTKAKMLNAEEVVEWTSHPDHQRPQTVRMIRSCHLLHQFPDCISTCGGFPATNY